MKYFVVGFVCACSGAVLGWMSYQSWFGILGFYVLGGILGIAFAVFWNLFVDTDQ